MAKKTDSVTLPKWEPLVQAEGKSELTPKDRKSMIKGRIPVWLACFRAMREWPSVELDELACPTMLLIGDRNKKMVAWVEANRQALEQADVCVSIIAGLTHPQEFTKIEQVFPPVASFLYGHGCCQDD